MAATEKRITIRDPRTNNTCKVLIEDMHTMREITNLIVTEFNLTTDNYYLTRSGEVLNPEETVKSAGIVDDDELIIFPDPVGGAQMPESLWKKRLDTEMKEIENLEFYSTTYQDYTTSKPYYRIINVKLSDAPGWTKLDENAQPVLSPDQELEIRLNRDYPDSPPEIRFVSPIFHPNVYPSDKRVCIGMLNGWEGTFKVFQLIQAVDQLVSNPNLEDPADEKAASWYRRNPIEAPIRPWYEKHPPKQLPRIVSQPRVVKKPRVVE